MKEFSELPYKNDFKSSSEPNKLSSVLLKCGNSGSAILPEGSSLVTIFPIITLNTSRLSNPCIKFRFTSNIIAINLVGTFTFQLFKLCDGQLQATTVGPQWIFSRVEADNADISTFSFSVCDCDVCPSKKCKYAVVMIPSGGNTGSVVVTNGTLSALVVGKPCVNSMEESIFNDKHVPCSKVHLEPSHVISKCGNIQSTVLGGSSNNIATATVASVSVNTSCLRNPCKILEFTGNIIVPTITANVTLNFQIYKNCTNEFQRIPVGSPWTFLTPVTTSDMFTFFVCDCNTCSDECCNYIVEVNATGLANNETGVTTTVTINAATLSAFAVDYANENC